jgi:hypothetical protein
LPRVTSRVRRSPVEAGSIPYSAVTHPAPAPRRHPGTDSSTAQVQITRVSPISINALPCAVGTKCGSIRTWRKASAVRPSGRAVSATGVLTSESTPTRIVTGRGCGLCGVGTERRLGCERSSIWRIP